MTKYVEIALAILCITVPSQPLEKKLTIATFQAVVTHREQMNSERICKKCLQPGHSAYSCENQLVCLACRQPGHRRGESCCPAFEEATALAVQELQDRKEQEQEVRREDIASDHSDSSESESEGEHDAESESQSEEFMDTVGDTSAAATAASSAPDAPVTELNAEDAEKNLELTTTDNIGADPNATPAPVSGLGTPAITAGAAKDAVGVSEKKKKKKKKQNANTNEEKERGRDKQLQTTLNFELRPRSSSSKRRREKGDSPQPEDKRAHTC